MTGLKLSRTKLLAALIAAIVTLTAVWTPTVYVSAYDEDVYSHETRKFFLDDIEYAKSIQEYLGPMVKVNKKLQNIIDYNVFSGGTKFKGAGQCYGYAESVRKIFGTGGRTKKIGKKSTKANWYKVLKNCRPGTHVRLGNVRSGEGLHSIVVYKVTKDTIYFSHANWDRANGIFHCAYPLESVAGWYKYIQWIIEPTGKYTSKSVQAGGYSSFLTGKITLAWRPVAGAKSYTVYRAKSKKGKYKKLKTVKGTRYNDSTAGGGTVYYKVKAKTSKKTISSKPVAVAHAPIAPTVTATHDSGGNIVLSWDPVVGAEKYQIYDSYYDEKKDDVVNKKIATTGKTKYTLKPEQVDQNYPDLKVRAVAADGKTKSEFTYVYYEFAGPKPEIVDASISYQDEYEETPVFTAKLTSGSGLYHADYANIKLYRSSTIDGKYTLVTGAALFTTEKEKAKFDWKTATVKLYDYDREKGSTYYYKVACGFGYSSTLGLASDPYKY